MSEVKINVGAGVQGVEQAISRITSQMNKLGAAVAKSQGLKFSDTSVKLMERDLALVNGQFQQAIALSAQLRNGLKQSGQSGAQLSQVDWSKVSSNPQAAQRMRDRAFNYAVRGTSLDPTLANDVDSNGNVVAPAPESGGSSGGGGGRNPPRRPRAPAEPDEPPRRSFRSRALGGFGRAAGAFGGGAGGVVGTAAGSLEEAAAAAAAAPGAGLAMGPAAAAAFGAYAVYQGAQALGKALGEGLQLAKQQNEAVDLLKRQMGDVGVSFDDLIKSADTFSKGLGIADVDFSKLEMQANQASGGVYESSEGPYGDPKALGRATQTGAGLARAYGLDPSQGVEFIAAMRRMNPAQDDKRLAVEIAEAIRNSQGHATPGEVMQAMMSFAAAQNRFNGSNPGLDRFGNAYSSLMDQGVTSDRAQGILSTANAAVQTPGSEAVQNANMQTFGLDPIRTRIRLEGGLFANGLDNQGISKFMRDRGVTDWDSMSKGPAGGNAEEIVNYFDKAYAGRGAYGAEMELDALKNRFNLKSYADSAAFSNIVHTGDHNGVLATLQKAGIDPSQLNSSGLQNVAAVSRSTNIGDLEKLWSNTLKNLPGITDAERAQVASAEQSGNFDQLQNALTRVAASHGQESTPGSDQRGIDTSLKNMETDIGGKLVPMTNTIMEGIVKMAGLVVSPATTGSGSPYAYGGGAVPGRKGIVAQAGGAARAPGGSTVGGAGNARMLRGPVNPDAMPFGDASAAWANGIYGATLGGAYEINGGVIDGMQQLAGMGVDKGHAAAIMANAARESSMNPAARNGTHYGLFQLDATRQADFQKVMGKSIVGSSAADQIKYMVQSMRTGGEEAGPGKEFWESSGADAAGVFARKVERTDHPGKESDIRSAMAQEFERNITINLELHNTSADGKKSTQKLSTTVQKPSGPAMLRNNPIIVRLPG